MNYSSLYDTDSDRSALDFTGFGDIKLRTDEPVINQLRKQQKRLLYSVRKSAKEFYDKNDSGIEDVEITVDYEN